MPISKPLDLIRPIAMIAATAFLLGFTGYLAVVAGLSAAARPETSASLAARQAPGG